MTTWISLGHHAKWNKPKWERWKLHGITYMCNPKNNYTPTHRNRIKKWLPGDGVGEGKRERLVKGFKLIAMRWVSYEDLKYNMVTIVNTALYD